MVLLFYDCLPRRSWNVHPLSHLVVSLHYWFRLHIENLQNFYKKVTPSDVPESLPGSVKSGIMDLQSYGGLVTSRRMV